MATKSVSEATLPAIKFDRGDCSTESSFQRAWEALEGAEAIDSIIIDNICGEGKDHWSEQFIEKLHMGQKALLLCVKQEIQWMNHELWYMHALNGDYTPEAKARAEREIEATQRKEAVQ